MKNNLNELLKTLRKETMVMSSPNQMAETKSYKEIEKEGKVFVPFLIESLGKEDMPTIAILGLLHKLTGETPFTPDKRGHIDEMIAAWKVWKPKSLKEEATQIILESAKKREKKTAKPIPHEDIGDPNQKILAAENTNSIKEDKENKMTNNFNLSDSLIDAVKKIHDAEVEKQATSASDAEEKNAQFLVDQAERIAKYAKQVFGEIDEEQLDELSNDRKERYKNQASWDALSSYASGDVKRTKKRLAGLKKAGDTSPDVERAVSKWKKKLHKEELEPEEQLDELSKGTMERYKGKAKFDAVHSLARDDIGRAKKRLAGLDTAKKLQKEEAEEQIDEKYIGFKKLEGKLAGKGVRNPGAVAASIGRKKYGAAKFNKAAHEHKKMNEETDYIEEAMKQRIIDKVMELRNKDK